MGSGERAKVEYQRCKVCELTGITIETDSFSHSDSVGKSIPF